MQVAASLSRPVCSSGDSFHTRAHICFSTLVKSTQTGAFDRPLLAQVMSSTSFHAPLGPSLAPDPAPVFVLHVDTQPLRRAGGIYAARLSLRYANLTKHVT